MVTDPMGEAASLGEVFNRRACAVTAHRGFSGRYPENTLPAFEKAIDIGADMVEFDLRGSKDNVPLLLHDRTIDRTSDGTGSPNVHTFAELKKFNFSYWQGGHDKGERLKAPLCDGVRIPSFEELLELAAGKVCMNIQVYETAPPLLERVCALYAKYSLYGSAYLSLDSWETAEKVKRIDPEIALCALDRDVFPFDPEGFGRLWDFGFRYVQPNRRRMTPEFCAALRKSGLRGNVFYSNCDADNRSFAACGIHGVLTDYPDILIKSLKEIKMR